MDLLASVTAGDRRVESVNLQLQSYDHNRDIAGYLSLISLLGFLLRLYNLPTFHIPKS